MELRKTTDQLNKKVLKIGVAALLLGILSACLPQNAIVAEFPTATSQAQKLGTPTAPIQWFPATSTPTLFPMASITPAPEARSDVGALISDSELTSTANWSNVSGSNNDPNRLIWQGDALHFAVNEPPSALITLNKNIYTSNFYLEADLTINRCSQNDTYGVSFLAATEKFNDRFVIRCDGNIRVIQVRDSLTLPLLGWEFTGAAPPSAPGVVKVAVWVNNGELRFFLDDQIQFSITDRYYTTGGIGFFVESQDPAGMNIKIENLKVYELDPNMIAPTNTPLP